ncbi:uncharacterized protein LOC120627350 [Pararge aegeria]|uniref:uncharacterized protein LOC120627350 n=1 Tax=Pararge aegeria TaxID=116150 RepID=UPI0019CF5EE1|nr:uncharacterized protein LOC120627350 [Pararge aegeria]
MNSDEQILSFMDLLDLDEEIIDLRAKNLMERSTFTAGHLNNFIHLLNYKQLINIRENSECDNESEYHFIGKLITVINDENVDAVCKIISTVLSLNPSTVVFKSEHLIQQILAEIYLPAHTNVICTETDLEKLKTTFLHMKICGSILDAVEKCNAYLSLPFLSTPLEHLICSKEEKIFIYFLTNTVPRLFTTVKGFNILDRIWDFLKELKDEESIVALKVICCLSNYYLPVADSRTTIESQLIFESMFWDFIFLGLSSEDAFARKQSMYLAKRAIDYIMKTKKNVNISSKSSFIWTCGDRDNLKKMWDNFFILIDSLEEKQSNIVLPSIKLFEAVKDIGHCWLNCAFNIGLKHDNTHVKLRCLHYHLQYGIHSVFEAKKILEAINDIALSDHLHECNIIKDELINVIKDNAILMSILKALPLVKWSPVQLYHVTKIIMRFDGVLSQNDQTVLIDLVSVLSIIPCNNVIIRKCIHINISHLIGNCCKDLPWQKYIPVYTYLQYDKVTTLGESKFENTLENFIKNNIVIPQEDTVDFLKLLSSSHANIDFALLYFDGHEDSVFLDFIDEVLDKIEDISNRPYSDKTECFEHVIFIANLLNKSLQKHGGIYDKINTNSTKKLKTLLQYFMSILVSDMVLNIEKITFLFENLDDVITKKSNFPEKEIMLLLYKATTSCLQDNDIIIDQKVLSIFILCYLLKSPLFIENYKQELLDTKTVVEMIANVKFIDNLNKENCGRLRNAFYEKSCEIVNILVQSGNLESNILGFINVVIESGGYGCLKWILRIMNRILPTVLNDKDNKFDVIQYLNRMWIEIEELRSNSQYPICMKEFIIMITHDALLKKPVYNNIVLSYCTKIIDYASVKNMPLYLLVKQLNKINISQYNHMVYVLSEIVLNPVISRKDHKIVENALLEILREPIYGADKHNIYFNSHIQLIAASIVSKISEPEVLNTLICFMIKKIEELFKTKQRYHINSHLQKALQACVQNLLIILLKSRNVKIESSAMWCMEFLGRIPHQPFERICLEWYISLYYYMKKSIVNEEILHKLKSNNVPLSSQFIIMHWIVLHKLKTGICLNQEYDFLMQFLLSHIMGPVFSIRLQAQYLSSILYEANEHLSKNKLDNSKFAYVIKVINITLQEIAKVGDKSFKTLKNDYFVNKFDIVEDLIPGGIYWILPRLADVSSNATIEDGFLKDILSHIEVNLSSVKDDEFHNEWKEQRRKTSDVLKLKANDIVVNKEFDNLKDTGTIQKKYVPWRNMSDIDVYNSENNNNKTELIVVASLIDKLPNLGGMARTSEVFGVQTYVVDSVRHLQDKQFQGLSVSAERWVTIEEVRPGNPLKDYLMVKKTEGYSVVAAEQTSTSTNLQSFKFPKKTLLLLGNEKEGVPCDLLPLMDHCVEIPQQGVIRSLNVHVTAAIFIWEYARQNML